MELVTGKAGVPHVSSADDGRRIAGEVGAGSYVLQTGGRLAPSLVDANTVRFATGDMIVQGRHIGITSPEDVKVASGSQGKKRMDYICVHYSRDVSGPSPTLVETVEWTVLRGTPGTDATAPSVPRGSILDGDSDVTVPISSVTFDGLTTGQPKLLIPELTPLATLGDSVSLYETKNWGVVRVGMTVYVRAVLIIADPAEGITCPYVIPEELRPSHAWSAAMVTEYGGADNSYRLLVMPDGTIKVHSMSGKTDHRNHFASLSYPIGM
ncbi:hypothetical protein [Collinsella sp. AF38-3AC]|uniref:hypothetical protein n=1 Tax=Collinsella sp. AF38-3AC TaxID=2292015 RepID=UPI000E4D24DD|nr:hypothetical protein [Collinsella sp. AF38-3AC]RHL25536.1 hypothetical protein DW029_03665 [Collinsella sp. AF38-3AC]